MPAASPASSDAIYVALNRPGDENREEGRFSTVALLAAVALTAGLANGYNATLLEGAIPRLSETHVLKSAWQAGVLAGSLSLGGLIGSLACTEISYRLSRRWMVLFGEVTIIFGAAMFACAPNFALVLSGRVVTGVGVGICGLSKPLIVSELAPAHRRGTLVSLFAIGQSLGLNAFYIIDFLMPPTSVAWAWRLLVALGASPAILVAIIVLLTPASAYWDVPPSGSTCAEETFTPTQQLHRMLTVEPPQVRRNFLLIVAIMLGYNLSGTLIIMNYASQIFATAGRSDRSLPIAVGFVQFLGLVSAAVGTDRLGRRPLLLLSCALTSLCLFGIAALLHVDFAPLLADLRTPLLLVLMVTVEYAVGVGLNPIRILLSAELMPNRYRPLGMSLGNAVGWGTALLSLLLFPIFSALAGGPAPQFAFFGATTACLTAVVALYLPETKGIDFQ